MTLRKASLSLSTLLLLFGCGEVRVDADGDGSLSTVDCDDNDAWLNDLDLDGDGYSTCDGDCDDDNPAELDDLDLDGDGYSTCDGDCDDGDPEVDSADVDGDGYSTCDGDCDDVDANLVNDCEWSIASDEVGDDPSQVDDLGLIQIPKKILGNAHSTGNDGSVWTGDLDVMKFMVPASGPVTFSLTWSASAADYDFWLIDMTGTTLAYSWEYGADFENFAYTLSSQTEYLLAVGAWSGPGGDWAIRIE